METVTEELMAIATSAATSFAPAYERVSGTLSQREQDELRYAAIVFRGMADMLAQRLLNQRVAA